MLSESTQKYLSRLSSARPESDQDVSTVHVDYVSSKIATLYEKLRQVIDYQEEHLLRKNTIERVLKRRLLLSLNPEEVAKPLVFELIRGGYFPNDKIPEAKIEAVRKLLEKYAFLIENLPPATTHDEKNKMNHWLQGLAALDIEETLSPPRREIAILDYMVDELLKRLVFTDASLTSKSGEQRKRELVFVACQKALLKSDPSLLGWWLLKLQFPEFPNSPTPEFLAGFVQKLPAIRKDIENRLADPLVKRIREKAYRFTPIFLLLQDVVLDNPSEAAKIFDSPESLETRIKLAYDRKYKLIKKENRRSGLRWVISILLSKMVLALLIEVPYDQAHQMLSPLAFSINLFVPPLLMFLIVYSIRSPKEERKSAVCWEAMRIVYAQESPETVKIQKSAEKKGFAYFFVKLIFFLSSSAVFAGTIYLLLQINFSWLSIVIFLAFFSLIAFSGMRIEAATRQFRGEDKGGEVLGFLVDILFLPFRNVGKFLSGQLQKYNLIILVLNLFFEAPLQVFFEFVENWRDYLKKKREEME